MQFLIVIQTVSFTLLCLKKKKIDREFIFDFWPGCRFDIMLTYSDWVGNWNVSLCCRISAQPQMIPFFAGYLMVMVLMVIWSPRKFAIPFHSYFLPTGILLNTAAFQMLPLQHQPQILMKPWMMNLLILWRSMKLKNNSQICIFHLKSLYWRLLN